MLLPAHCRRRRASVYFILVRTDSTAPVNARISYTRSNPGHKILFFWLGYGWMITFPKNLTNDNTTIISPLLSGTYPKTANFFFKKIKWASILMYRGFPSPLFMATPILLQAVLDQFRQLFLTAQMNKNSTKERLIKRAVVCPGLLVKTWERRRLNVSSMHGWMDMDIFTCRTSFSYRRTTHASHILPLRLSRKEDFCDSFKKYGFASLALNLPIMKQWRDYYILDIGTLSSKRGALAKKKEKKHASLRVPHNFLCNNNLFLDFGYSFFSKNQSENKAMSSQIEEYLHFWPG